MRKIEINGETYVLESDIKNYEPAEKVKGLKYCIVRGNSSGVFAGYIKERKGQETEMVNVRRLWYWKGANSLSDLAIKGTTNPDDCKFTAPVNNERILDTIEILEVTKAAQENITEVFEWTMK